MSNRWGNNGNSDRLYFLGSKITADGDCSHEIKRHLLLGRKVMTNLDSILNSRDITLPTKVYLVKAMVFPVVMYGCENWTIKKAECQRIDSLEKIPMLGKIEGRRRRGRQRMRWLDGITDWWTWVWAGSRSWWWVGKPGVLQSMASQRVGQLMHRPWGKSKLWGKHCMDGVAYGH